MEQKKRFNPLSWSTKLRVIEEYKLQGYKPLSIAREMNQRGYQVTRWSVAYLINKYEKHGSISRQIGSGRPSKIRQPHVLSYVQQQMRESDETTGKELCQGLREIFTERSCINARLLLGWDCKKTQYGFSTRTDNIVKRKEFAISLLEDMKNGYSFRDCIFVDESKIELDPNMQRCCRRRGEPVKKKPVYKHPISVMIWAGISKNGKTQLVISKGIMYREHYAAIMQDNLLPFIEEAYPDGDHRLWQDNEYCIADPKHNSKTLKYYFENENINWVKTPPESADMNPIELVWKEMKGWLRKNLKNVFDQDGLIEHIIYFWENVFTVEDCRKYINHMYKVVPAVIRADGHATEY